MHLRRFIIIELSTVKNADPDDQDSYGNTVLHMVVVTGQLVSRLVN